MALTPATPFSSPIGRPGRGPCRPLPITPQNKTFNTVSELVAFHTKATLDVSPGRLNVMRPRTKRLPSPSPGLLFRRITDMATIL